MNMRQTLVLSVFSSFIAVPSFANLNADLANVANAYAEDQRIEARKAEALRQRQAKLNAAKLEIQKRQLAFEEEMRAIELESAKLRLLEEKKLALEIQRSRAKHAEAFVEAELAREKASIDVIQSQADANRTLAGVERKKLETPKGK